MNNTIYYICCYDNYNNRLNLQTQPSAVSKINYIKSALKEAGYEVFIFSVAEGKNNNTSFNKALCINSPQEIQYYIASFGRKRIIFKILSRLLMYIQLFWFLIFKLNKQSKILIYHNLAIKNIIRFVDLFFRRNFYLEVEEIYNAVYNNNDNDINKEINYLKNKSGYIFVNDIIQSKTNITGKGITCYGNYSMEVASKINMEVSKNINVVYAGVIGDIGSDVYLAVEVAKLLPKEYSLHILGYGEDIHCKNFIEYIKNIEVPGQLLYHGCLLGDAYKEFLSKCHIGLCPRVLEDKLSDYSFPSKIMVYLSHGLIPVCTPITCVSSSSLREYIYISNNIEPQSIAEIIKNIDVFKPKDTLMLFTNLHKNFVQSLKVLFQ